MTEKILSLAKKLITFQSSFENKKELERIFQFTLSHFQDFNKEYFERNGVKSVLIYNKKRRPKKFTLLLNGHLDIIPAKKNQFIPVIKNDRLYGAGAMDMKANIACLIIAFQEMAHRVSYPLGLQLVTDEEVGGFDGTKYQIEKGVLTDFVLSAEPTNFDIVHQAKGILILKISAKGKTAHGAYPWRGKNAIWMMHNFLSNIQKEYTFPKQEQWVTTLNLNSIETSNKAYNKIPDDCSVSFDVRFVLGEKEIFLEKLKKLMPKNFSLEILVDEDVLYTDPKNNSLLLLQAISKKILKKEVILRGAQGSSDARHFSQRGCPGIEFGPIGGGIGSDEEWVNIPSLSTYYQILSEYILKSK
ncbi:MAG: M20/M25/M40 family metallo-hydrolase [Candidatus Moraniibacteriota bacterium]|nr:MAG: M20/M25/M40 family metallo-hydrolase [Candidatus Moranbacteria bacterium]